MQYKIVFPEGNDERIIAAAQKMIDRGICHPVLIGDREKLRAAFQMNDQCTCIAVETTNDSLTQGAHLVANGTADAIIAGAAHATADVLRAYIRIIGTQEGVSRATSCFLMEKENQKFIFADCGVNIDPTSETLAETAYLCSTFALLVNIEPKIAFLSFSTHGSAKHESISKVTEALTITKEKWPDLTVDGELQVDAALVPDVASAKAPNSPLKGQATILIFPDLNAGNIAYKLTERLGGFSATGPILLGFAKPAHDLSRGCSVDDIVHAAEIACMQCEQQQS